MDLPVEAVTKFLYGKPRDLQDTAELLGPVYPTQVGVQDFQASSAIQLWICFEIICNNRIVICG